jgi:uncharacterized phage protein (TIGR02218 family)
VPILRPCSGALATALATGVRLDRADLFTISLLGASIYHWTSYDVDLTVAGQLFASSSQFLSRGRSRVINTMEVPTLEIYLLDTSTAGFTGVGTPRLRTQIHNGLLDGANVLLQRVFMPAGTTDTATYGTIDLFSGDVGAVELSEGAKATIKVRGKNSRLDVPAPVNVYQPGCIHTFCDAGCTLNPATFTVSRTVLASPTPTRTSIAFVSSSTALALLLKSGKVTMTSGPNSGQQRTITDALVVGANTILTLTNPLFATPSAGDTFTTFQACDKTIPTCNAVYSNLANFRGFPFIPPPPATSVGQ